MINIFKNKENIILKEKIQTLESKIEFQNNIIEKLKEDEKFLVRLLSKYKDNI